MLQTTIVRKKTKNDPGCVAVCSDATEIYLRVSGRAAFGTEEMLARIIDGEFVVDPEVAKKHGISVRVK